VQLATTGSSFSDTDLFTLIKYYMLPNIVYPFPKSLFSVELITKNFPNPKSEVKKDSLGFPFLKQLVSIEEQRPS